MNLLKLSRVYDRWAAEDPFRAACTERDAWTEQEFFAYGIRHIDGVMTAAEKLRPVPRGAALDFGCGPGRLVNALAKHFPRVIGVDVSQQMIETARRLQQNPACTFVLNQAPDLRQFESGTFDFVHTCKVLQHIRPDLSVQYIGEFMRLLTPGGMAVFQVPERPKGVVGGLVLLWAPARLLRVLRRIDMYGLNESTVRAAVERAGGTVLRREPCDDAGPRWEDWRYFAVRNPTKAG